MIDIRLIDALEELFAKEPHSIGRYDLHITVDYGTVTIDEERPEDPKVAELEEEIEELKATMEEINVLSNY